MFESHFGFIRRPFTAAPDVELFAENESARDASEAIEYCLRGGQGIAILTGPTGVGKTMLCQRLINELRDEHCISFLPSPGTPSQLGLLQAIYFGLGKRVKRRHAGISDSEMRLELVDSIRGLRVHSTGIVVIVDEAHLLDPQQLEEIRILSSFADRGQPLVRPLLCGNPELEERLLEPGLKAFSQRIRCQQYLQPLTKAESIELIQHQVVRAGSRNRDIFTADALNAIAEASDGNPRCINQLCDQALYIAARDGLAEVSSETVHAALDDVVQLPLNWKQPLSTNTSPGASVVETQKSASCIEIGGLEPSTTSESVVEFGTLDGEDIDTFASSDVVPAQESNETVYRTRPVEIDATESCSEASGTMLEADIVQAEPLVAHDCTDESAECFRHGLPEAPRPFAEVSVADKYSNEDAIIDETDKPLAVVNYDDLQPRFDAAEPAGDLLPGSHFDDQTRGVSAHELAAAAANSRSIQVQDRWSEHDQVRSTSPLSTEPVAVSAEERLLNSCVETRREIATMLDTLENHVSESLADQYDVVMPEPPQPDIRIPLDNGLAD